ncbi:MAG TPA: DMT family transporter [Nocardioidaceae bacterium]|nr:DMT family transporter [Nocardioidaceae bacterium]
MVVVLALASSLCYGLADFVGGLLARRTGAWSVAVVGNTSATFCTAVVAFLVAGEPTPADWVWGTVAGVGAGFGTVFLYRGLAGGRMSVVAPLSAVGAALLPVLVGVASGERPGVITWAGLGCAFPAIWLISRAAEPAAGGQASPSGGVVDGLMAGLGFGLLFAALAQIPDAAGLGPLALTQGVSVVAIISIATGLRRSWLPRDRFAAAAVGAGALAALATWLFLVATQSGFLTVAAVLSSLYPASTVLLAALVLHEHIDRGQGLGLLLAAVSVGLVAVG